MSRSPACIQLACLYVTCLYTSEPGAATLHTVVNRTTHQGTSHRLLFSNQARFYRPVATEMNTGDQAEVYSQPLRVGGAWCFFFRRGVLVWVLLAMEHGGYKKPIH